MAWKVPALPRPWQRTRVLLSIRMLICLTSLRRGYHLLGGIGHAGRVDDILSALRQQLPPLFDVGAFQPHHQRHMEADFLERRQDRPRDDVALHDAAEDVDQYCLDPWIRQQD